MTFLKGAPYGHARNLRRAPVRFPYSLTSALVTSLNYDDRSTASGANAVARRHCSARNTALAADAHRVLSPHNHRVHTTIVGDPYSHGSHGLVNSLSRERFSREEINPHWTGRFGTRIKKAS